MPVGVAILNLSKFLPLREIRYPEHLAGQAQQDALRCGVPTGIPGFGTPASEGTYPGFDVDLCKAIAAGDTRRP